MGLAPAEIERHIAHWEAALAETQRNYRDKWPSRLFHHAALENATGILASGQLLSRNDAQAVGFRDVAAQEVVNTNQYAHQFGRLYFRPRTPTQFHIEGIRRPDECYEPTAHAPMLFMFVFSARSVLALPDTNFSTGNMQSRETPFGPTLTDFEQIDFARVFHEGPFSAEDGPIVFCRSAEVLAPSPLPIDGHLQAILCRTRAERQTLLHKIGDVTANRWADYVRVSDDIQVFERKYRYIEDVSITPGGIVFRIHPHSAIEQVSIQVEAVRVSTGKVAVTHGPTQMQAIPPNGRWWRVSGAAPLRSGTYKVRILLEGHLAFEAEMSVAPEPF